MIPHYFGARGGTVRLAAAVFEQGERVMLNVERLGQRFEGRGIDALDGMAAQHAEGAGARDVRPLGELVGRAPALGQHVRFDAPEDHRPRVYGKRFLLTTRQRTLTILLPQRSGQCHGIQ